MCGAETIMQCRVQDVLVLPTAAMQGNHGAMVNVIGSIVNADRCVNFLNRLMATAIVMAWLSLGYSS